MNLGKGQTYDEEYRIVRPDKTIRWVRDRGYPVKKNNKVDHIVGIAQDITKSKQIEEALQESEERHRSIYENVHDAIIYTNKTGKIITANPQVEKILGYKVNELIGFNFAKFTNIFEPSQIPYLVSKLKQAGRVGKGPPELDLKIKNKKGKSLYIHVSTSQIIENKKVVGFVNIIRDITTEKISDERLKEKVDELERANKAMVGREIKMIELKNRIKELEEQLEA